MLDYSQDPQDPQDPQGPVQSPTPKPPREFSQVERLFSLSQTPGLPQNVRDGLRSRAKEKQGTLLSLAVATKQDPQLAAETKQMAERLGVSEQDVANNPTYAKALLQAVEIQAAEQARRDPVLTRYMQDPELAKIAWDDYTTLKSGGVWVGNWAGGQLEAEKGRVGTLWRQNRATPADMEYLAEIEHQLLYELPSGNSWYGGPARLLGQMSSTIPRALRYGVSLAATAGIVGQMGPQAAFPEEVVTMPGAFWTGFYTGMTEGAFKIEGGIAYVDYRRAGYDHETARWSSFVVGALNSAAELVATKYFTVPALKGIGSAAAAGVRKLMQRKIRENTVEAVTAMTAGRALLKFAGGVAGGSASEISTEEFQELTLMVGEEISRAMSDTVGQQMKTRRKSFRGVDRSPLGVGEKGDYDIRYSDDGITVGADLFTAVTGMKTDRPMRLGVDYDENVFAEQYDIALPLSSAFQRGEVMQRLAETAIYTMKGVWLLAGVGPGVQLAIDSHRVKGAKRRHELLLKGDDAAALSKLAERDPNTFERYWADQFQNQDGEGRSDTVYVNKEIVTRLLEGLGMTKEELAVLLPDVARQLDESADVDSDIAIPVSEWLGKKLFNTPLGQAMQDHLRLGGKDSLSFAESAVYNKQVEEQVKALEENRSKLRAARQERRDAEAQAGKIEELDEQIAAVEEDIANLGLNEQDAEKLAEAHVKLEALQEQRAEVEKVASEAEVKDRAAEMRVEALEAQIQTAKAEIADARQAAAQARQDDNLAVAVAQDALADSAQKRLDEAQTELGKARRELAERQTVEDEAQAEEAEQKAPDARQLAQETTRIRQRLLRQLRSTGKFDSSQARIQSGLFAHMLEVMAVRLGMTPEAFEAKYGQFNIVATADGAAAVPMQQTQAAIVQATEVVQVDNTSAFNNEFPEMRVAQIDDNFVYFVVRTEDAQTLLNDQQLDLDAVPLGLGSARTGVRFWVERAKELTGTDKLTVVRVPQALVNAEGSALRYDKAQSDQAQAETFKLDSTLDLGETAREQYNELVAARNAVVQELSETALLSALAQGNSVPVASLSAVQNAGQLGSGGAITLVGTKDSLGPSATSGAAQDAAASRAVSMQSQVSPEGQQFLQDRLEAALTRFVEAGGDVKTLGPEFTEIIYPSLPGNTTTSPLYAFVQANADNHFLVHALLSTPGRAPAIAIADDAMFTRVTRPLGYEFFDQELASYLATEGARILQVLPATARLVEVSAELREQLGAAALRTGRQDLVDSLTAPDAAAVMQAATLRQLVAAAEMYNSLAVNTQTLSRANREKVLLDYMGRYISNQLQLNGESVEATPENILEAAVRLDRSASGATGPSVINGRSNTISLTAARDQLGPSLYGQRWHFGVRAKSLEFQRFEVWREALTNGNRQAWGEPALRALFAVTQQDSPTVETAYRALEAHGFTDVAPDVVQETLQIAELVRANPFDFFESQLDQSVGIDRFQIAMVSPTVDQVTRRALRDRGLRVFVYGARRVVDTTKALNTLDDGSVLRQDQDPQSDIGPLYSRLTRAIQTTEGKKAKSAAQWRQAANAWRNKGAVGETELDYSGFEELMTIMEAEGIKATPAELAEAFTTRKADTSVAEAAGRAGAGEIRLRELDLLQSPILKYESDGYAAVSVSTPRSVPHPETGRYEIVAVSSETVDTSNIHRGYSAFSVTPDGLITAIARLQLRDQKGAFPVSAEDVAILSQQQDIFTDPLRLDQSDAVTRFSQGDPVVVSAALFAELGQDVQGAAYVLVDRQSVLSEDNLAMSDQQIAQEFFNLLSQRAQQDDLEWFALPTSLDASRISIAAETYKLDWTADERAYAVNRGETLEESPFEGQVFATKEEANSALAQKYPPTASMSVGANTTAGQRGLTISIADGQWLMVENETGDEIATSEEYPGVRLADPTWAANAGTGYADETDVIRDMVGEAMVPWLRANAKKLSSLQPYTQWQGITLAAKTSGYANPENYREFVWVFDTRAKKVGKPPRGSGSNQSYYHFQDAIFHVRVYDVYDAQGRKMLWVQEFQSDWARAGYAQGLFKYPEAKRGPDSAVVKEYNKLKDQLDVAQREYSVYEDAAVNRRIALSNNLGDFSYNENQEFSPAGKIFLSNGELAEWGLRRRGTYPDFTGGEYVDVVVRADEAADIRGRGAEAELTVGRVRMLTRSHVDGSKAFAQNATLEFEVAGLHYDFANRPDMANIDVVKTRDFYTDLAVALPFKLMTLLKAEQVALTTSRDISGSQTADLNQAIRDNSDFVDVSSSTVDKMEINQSDELSGYLSVTRVDQSLVDSRKTLAEKKKPLLALQQRVKKAEKIATGQGSINIAPLVTSRNAWNEFAVKRVTALAVRENYAGVVFITGDEGQVASYGVLSGQRAAYDTDLPNAVKKSVLKKGKAKLEKIAIPFHRDVKAADERSEQGIKPSAREVKAERQALRDDANKAQGVLEHSMREAFKFTLLHDLVDAEATDFWSTSMSDAQFQALKPLLKDELLPYAVSAISSGYSVFTANDNGTVTVENYPLWSRRQSNKFNEKMAKHLGHQLRQISPVDKVGGAVPPLDKDALLPEVSDENFVQGWDANSNPVQEFAGLQWKYVELTNPTYGDILYVVRHPNHPAIEFYIGTNRAYNRFSIAPVYVRRREGQAALANGDLTDVELADWATAIKRIRTEFDIGVKFVSRFATKLSEIDYAEPSVIERRQGRRSAETSVLAQLNNAERVDDWRASRDTKRVTAVPRSALANTQRKVAETRSVEDVDRYLEAFVEDPVAREKIAERIADDLLAVQEATAKSGWNPGFYINDKIRQMFGGEQPYLQEGEEDMAPARGAINLRTMAVSLGPNASVSTFFHESAHYFFELMLMIAQRGDATQDILDDLAVLAEWGNYASVDQLLQATRAERKKLHEAFAYSFEKYLANGKVESADRSLLGLLRSVRRWIVNAYRDMVGSTVNAIYQREFGEAMPELSEEVQAVMSRLIQTQEMVEYAKKVRSLSELLELIGSQENLSQLSKEELAQVQQLLLNADFEAEEQLGAMMLRQLRYLSNFRSRFLRDIQKQTRAARKQVEDDERERLQNQGIYRLQKFLTTGEFLNADGEAEPTGLPSNRLLRTEQTASLPDRMLSNTGVSADVLAPAFGFQSGDDLIDLLASSQTLDEAVAAATDRRMLDEFSELTDPSIVEERLIEAMSGPALQKLLATQLRAFDQGLPDSRVLVSAARVVARRAIGDVDVGALRPIDYSLAAGRAQRQAVEARRKGDLSEYRLAMRRALFQNAMAEEAASVRDELRKQTKRLRERVQRTDKKLASQGRLTPIVKLARQLLAAYGEATPPPEVAEDPRADVLAPLQDPDLFAPELYFDLSTLRNDALVAAKPLKEMKVDEALDALDTLDGLWFRSKREQDIVMDGKRVAVDSVLTEIEKTLEAHDRATRKVAGSLTKSEKRGRWLRAQKAQFTRMRYALKVLDRGKADGIFTKAIWRRGKDAANQMRLDETKYLKQVAELLDSLDLPEGTITARELSNGTDFVFGNDGTSGKAQLLMGLLHSGNESNLFKFTVGYNIAKYNPQTGKAEGVERWLEYVQSKIDDGTITKADMDAVQKIWDLMEEIKPLAQRAHFSLFGYKFKEIPAQPLTFSFPGVGEVVYRGGYVPALTDPNQVVDARLNSFDDSLEFQKAMPNVPRGFTQNRAALYAEPLDLDLRRLGVHIHSVLLFSHLAPAVKDIRRVVENPRFKRAIDAVDPGFRSEILVPWMEALASQRTTMSGKDAWGWLNRYRSRAGAATMFANIKNTAQNLTGIAVALAIIPRKYMFPALGDVLRDREGAMQRVADQSDYMRDRFESQNIYEVRDRLDALLTERSKTGSVVAWFEKNAYWIQRLTQEPIDAAVWIAAYNKAIADQGAGVDGETAHREAVYRADDAVQQTQTSNNPEDLSVSERGSAMAKLFLQFRGWFINYGNFIASETQIRRTGGEAEGSLAALYMIGIFVPLVGAEVIDSLVDGDPVDEDEDGAVWDDLLSRTLRAHISAITGAVPIWGDAAAVGFASLFDRTSWNARMPEPPTLSVLRRGLVSIRSGDFEDGRKLRSVLSMIATISGVPVNKLLGPAMSGYEMATGQADLNGQFGSAVEIPRALLTGRTNRPR